MASTKPSVLTPTALRARRLELGIGAVRVADSLGVPLSEVGRWERGEVLPDPMRWRLLARMLHIDEEVPLRALPRETGTDDVDVVIDLIGADPFVSIVARPSPPPARVARQPRLLRSLALTAVVLALAAALVWAVGGLGSAVGALLGAFVAR